MKKQGKVYRGEWVDNKRVVYVDDLVLSPEVGNKIITYSTDGFGWGSRGAGTSQLALSILLDYLKDRKKAIELHLDFQWCFLVNADHSKFQINASEIDEFLQQRKITPW